MNHILSIPFLCLNIITIWSFPAYDCVDTIPEHIKTLSINDVPNCHINETEIKTEKLNILYIQSLDYYKLPAVYCSIKVKRFIYNCGYWTDSPVKNSVSEYYQSLSSSECYRMVTSKQHTYYGTSISLSESHKEIQLIVAGYVDSTGKCKGAPFNYLGQTYPNAVVQDTLVYDWGSKLFDLDKKTKTIITPGGYECLYNKMVCETPDTTYFWNNIDMSCTQNYISVYEGPATKSTLQGKILFSINTTSFSDMVLVSSEINLCGYPTFSTEHPDFFIFIKGSVSLPNFKFVTSESAKNLNYYNYIRHQTIELSHRSEIAFATVRDELLLIDYT